MVTNIHEHKRYYYTFDNSLFTESIQNTTQIFPLNHNVRFLPSAPGRCVMQYVYALNSRVHRFNYSRTLPQRSSSSGLWT